MIELLRSLHAAFPLRDSMRHVARLSAWDRYQASVGINRAADYVAKILTGCGLEVAIHRLPCPSRWWSFDGPTSWTPHRAELSVAGQLIARYPDDAMCLAAYSVQTGRTEAALSNPGHRELKGTVLLADGLALGEAIEIAQRGEAIGIIADPLAGRLPGARGRIELPQTTGLFAFSVTGEEMAVLRGARSVAVEVEVARDAPMPLVEALLPGEDDQEILLQAHLCHPRPGANDNASGAAAVLGLASALSSLPGRRRRGIRFLFGPEFVGTVAYLHDFVERGRRPRPLAAINLDMVGENQALCGGPLTLELPPDHLPSPLGPLAAHVMNLVAGAGETYSGARAFTSSTATTVPFVGASDHGVHADRTVAIPAIMIGHWPDRFNHTSLDALDKVDPEELRRAALIAGAACWTLVTADRQAHDALQRMIVYHTMQRLLSASQSGGRADILDHIARCGEMTIDALENLTDTRDACGRVTIRAQRALLRSLESASAPEAPVDVGGTLTRTWAGPFNVRGLLHAVSGPHANRLRHRLANDKRTYAAILAIALAIDDASSRTGIVRRAAHSSMLQLDPAFADDVFDAMLSAAWIREP
ncbi:DUF4910 domain-containing protein [Bradyrhizobium elkanii]|uniref:DUF4910 domain-containing protein n=1 Tax=Bradyrhizobium elkanii TaxID=29448 RepID=UPI001BACD8BA|nr:DUF4910 domain-containing protein [Bradyrhizobium elkanii]MBR1158084.1 DUF4910 domain-containing protein [Bradyrhizobium elkanii]